MKHLLVTMALVVFCFTGCYSAKHDAETDMDGNIADTADADSDTDGDADSDTVGDTDSDTYGDADSDTHDPGILGQGSWYDPVTGLMWQNPALQTPFYGPSETEISKYCIDLRIGGFSDWRAPNMDELRSLVRGCSATETNGNCPLFDESLQEERTADCDGCEADKGSGFKGCYWGTFLEGACGLYYSSSHGSLTEPNDIYGCIDFDSGAISYSAAGEMTFVRCVRTGGDADMDTDSDTDREMVWYDSKHDLCWENPADETRRKQTDAANYCGALGLAGRSDWRLPTIDELRTLARGCPQVEPSGACTVANGGSSSDWNENNCANSCEERQGPGPNGYYWPDALYGGRDKYTSRSIVSNHSTYIWTQRYDNGAIEMSSDAYGYFVRCVRSGPC